MKAKKIYAVVNASALLHRKVEITSLELDDLTLDMLEDTHGKWNFENPPAQDPPPPAPPGDSSASFTLGIISKLTVVRGQFAAASLLASGVPGPSLMEVHGASFDLRQVDLSAFTTASLREPASAPGELAILAGWLNPIVYAADPEGPGPAGRPCGHRAGRDPENPSPGDQRRRASVAKLRWSCAFVFNRTLSKHEKREGHEGKTSKK